uniref:Uncharacterized protein n=1 Tax=Manihot esculenta TaxID=3983 RepID=A0A2C9UQJ5_MANES
MGVNKSLSYPNWAFSVRGILLLSSQPPENNPSKNLKKETSKNQRRSKSKGSDTHKRSHQNYMVSFCGSA